VQEIKRDGFTAVWLPPPSDAVSEQVGGSWQVAVSLSTRSLITTTNTQGFVSCPTMQHESCTRTRT